MFQDINSNKVITRNRIISIFQIMIGGLFTFVFGMTFIACVAELYDPEDSMSLGTVIFILCLLLISVYFLVHGIQKHSLTSACKRYMPLLSQNDTHSIQQLADFIRTPANVVHKNLENMIRKKYINGYIDPNTNTIRSTVTYGNAYNNSVPNVYPRPNVNNTMKAVEYTTSKCTNCGATLKIQKGVTTDCEYCGSPIQ